MEIEIPQPGRQARRVIAVHEEQPWWAPQLQRRFAQGDVAVRTCVRVEDAVDSRPDAMIVVACGDGTAAVRCLAELQRSGVQAFVVAIIPADLRTAEWRLRELGADAVVGDDVGADAVADVCRWALRAAEG